MKLRSLFLCAVFISAGIAFALAEEPASENTLRECTYFLGNPTAAEDSNTATLSFYNTAEKGIIDLPPIERNGFAGTGRNDYAIEYKNESTGPAVHDASVSAARESLPPAENILSNGDTTTAPTASRSSDDPQSLYVYDFSSSFYDSVTGKIGFTARNGKENPLVFSEVIAETADSSQLPEKETYSFLAFVKNVFTNAQSGEQIIFDSSYLKKEEEENAAVSFISVIAAPFSLLSVSLCIGLLIILFTSTGKKENA